MFVSVTLRVVAGSRVEEEMLQFHGAACSMTAGIRHSERSEESLQAKERFLGRKLPRNDG
ncbi:MAG: hypothetical protein Fur005_40030 [Roseiflexaceae bacterium]